MRKEDDRRFARWMAFRRPEFPTNWETRFLLRGLLMKGKLSAEGTDIRRVSA